MTSILALVGLASTSALAADAPPAPHGQVQPGPTIASPLAARPLDRLSATHQRPLLSPTRRPPPPVVQAAPPPPPALYGVIMDGENARAIIRARPTDKEIRVGIGDDVGGWKVSQIEGQRLVLSLDGRLATFVLFSGNTANGVPQPDVVPQSTDKVPQSTDKKQQIQQNPPALAPDRRGRQ